MSWESYSEGDYRSPGGNDKGLHSVKELALGTAAQETPKRGCAGMEPGRHGTGGRQRGRRALCTATVGAAPRVSGLVKPVLSMSPMAALGLSKAEGPGRGGRLGEGRGEKRELPSAPPAPEKPGLQPLRRGQGEEGQASRRRQTLVPLGSL